MDKTKFKDRTDWGHVANWYDKHLENDDTYHAKVILPNLTRLLGDMKVQNVLDLACGQGYFAINWAKSAKHVYGVDLGLGLIKLAEENYKKEQTLIGKSLNKKQVNFNIKDKIKNKLADIDFYVSPADNLEMIKDNTLDKITCVLALQNIEEVSEVFKECERVLHEGGRMYVVINHPSYRNPRNTHWGWDTEKNTQYRRIDEYISESKAKIDMNPGASNSNKNSRDNSENLNTKNHTWSFHRPLQYYFKAINKAGLYVGRLEEWISHKESQNGPRQAAEDKSRKEIPMFMMIEIIKI